MTIALHAFYQQFILRNLFLSKNWIANDSRFCRLIIFSLFFLLHFTTEAATITSKNVSGFWDEGTNWIGDVAPGPGDDVVIDPSATITIRTDVSCLSLTWTGNPSAARTLTINAGFTLTVNGNITISPPTSNNRNRTLSVLGILDCTGTFTMQASTDDRRRCLLSIGTNGIANIAGNLIMATTIARNWVQMTGSAVLNIGGNIGSTAAGTSAGGGFVTPTTVNFNGTLPQNFFPQTSVAIPTFKVNNAAGVIMRVAQSVTTLTIGDVTSNSLFKDSGNTVTSTGTLNLLNGSTYRLGRYSGGTGTATVFPAFTTSNIDLGTTVEYAHINANQNVSTTPQYANLSFSSTVARSRVILAGTLTVRGNLTIGVNTTFLGSTNNPAVNLGGNYSNSGTFTSGTGLFTMNGTTNQSITGTAAFTGGLTINNTGGGGSNTVTLNNNITTTGNLTITNGILDLGAFTANRTAAGGTMTISNGTRLIIGGTNSLPTNYTTHVIGATSTVEYDGTTNAVTAPNGGVAYGNLEIDATGATTSASFPVAGILSVLTSRSFVASAGTITMNDAASSITNSGTLSFRGLTIAATPTAQSQYNASYNVGATLTVNGSITFAPTGGTITMNNAGSGIVNNGSLTFSGLTIATTPTAQSQYNASYNVAGTLTVNGSITFAPTGGTITMNNASSAIVNNGTTTFSGLTIAVTPTAQSQYNTSYNVAGALTVDGGVTFAPTGGTITMNNAASSISNAGTLTFNNLTVSATPTSQAQYNTSFSVAGTFATSGAITFAPTGGTITMSGASGAINNASGTLTFSSLTITGTTISSTGNFAVAVTMNVTSTFAPAATSIISGAGTLTGAGTVRVTRTAATPSFGAQYTITTKTLANLTVNYIGAGAQTVDAQNYGNLTISTNGTRTITFVNGGTIRVSGVFSPTATTTTYVVTGNTFEYNGSGAQTIAAFTYNNLIISNAGAKTVLAGTTVNCLTITLNDDAVLTLPDTSVFNVTQ